MIATATLGSIMIKAGMLGLAALWVYSIKEDEEYVIDSNKVNEITKLVLPNHVTLFFIEDQADLRATLTSLEPTWDSNRLSHVENEYFSPETCGLTFLGSDKAIIYVNHIRDLFNDLEAATEKLYHTVFHEIYHILLNSSNEELINKKADLLYQRYKNVLPNPFTHYSNISS